MKKFNEPAKRLFIVTCNHHYITGILDHIQLIKQVWGDKSEIIVSDFPAPDQHNLIIEEFTNSEFTSLLREMKSKFPKTKFHILMTEVPSRERVNQTNVSGEVLLNASQFAHVESSLESHLARAIVRAKDLMVSGRLKVGTKLSTRSKLYAWRQNWLASAIRFGNRMLIILPPTPRQKFKHVAKSINKFVKASLPSFQKPNAAFMLRLSRYIIPKKLQQFASRIPTVLKEQSQLQYFRQRGHCLSSTADIFDSWLSMHPAIDAAVSEIFLKSSVTLFPEFSMASVRLKKEKADTLLFASTGAGSIYRDRVLSEISNVSRRGRPSFLAKRTGFVTNDYLFNNFHATLNVPQTGNWPISSPVRIYRSIVIGLPPIVWKKFDDHPIENCALELKKTLTIEEFYAFTDKLEQRVQSYNKIASDFNDTAFRTLQIEEQPVNVNQIEHFFDRKLFQDVQPLLKSPPRFLAEFQTENLVEFNSQMLLLPKYLGEVNFSSQWESLSKYIVNNSSDLMSIFERTTNQSQPILPIGTYNGIPFFASKTSIYKQDEDKRSAPEKNFWPDRESLPTLIGTIASISGLINVVHYGKSVFTLPPELGEVDVTDTSQDLNRFQLKKIEKLVDHLHASAGDIRLNEDDKITCVVGSSQFNIHPNRIFKRELRPQTYFKNLFNGPEKLVEIGTIFGLQTNYNLLFYANGVFSIPQSIGDINLKGNSQQFAKYSHRNSSSVAKFVLDIIDDFRKPQLNEDNKPVKLGTLYGSTDNFTLIKYQSDFYTIPSSLGEFDLSEQDEKDLKTYRCDIAELSKQIESEGQAVYLASLGDRSKPTKLGEIYGSTDNFTLIKYQSDFYTIPSSLGEFDLSEQDEKDLKTYRCDIAELSKQIESEGQAVYLASLGDRSKPTKLGEIYGSTDNFTLIKYQSDFYTIPSSLGEFDLSDQDEKDLKTYRCDIAELSKQIESEGQAVYLASLGDRSKPTKLGEIYGSTDNFTLIKYQSDFYTIPSSLGEFDLSEQDEKDLKTYRCDIAELSKQIESEGQAVYLASLGDRSKPTKLGEIYGSTDNFTLIKYQSDFYTIPSSLGEFDLSEQDEKDLKTYRCDIAELSKQIESEGQAVYLASLGDRSKPTKLGEIYGSTDNFTLIKYQSDFYTIPSSLGEFDLSEQDEKDLKTYRCDIAELSKQIESEGQAVYLALKDKNRPILLASIKNNNLVLFNQKMFWVPMGDDIDFTEEAKAREHMIKSRRDLSNRILEDKNRPILLASIKNNNLVLFNQKMFWVPMGDDIDFTEEAKAREHMIKSRRDLSNRILEDKNRPILLASIKNNNLVLFNQKMFWVPMGDDIDFTEEAKAREHMIKSRRDLSNRILEDKNRPILLASIKNNNLVLFNQKMFWVPMGDDIDFTEEAKAREHMIKSRRDLSNRILEDKNRPILLASIKNNNLVLFNQKMFWVPMGDDIDFTEEAKAREHMIKSRRDLSNRILEDKNRPILLASIKNNNLVLFNQKMFWVPMGDDIDFTEEAKAREHMIKSRRDLSKRILKGAEQPKLDLNTTTLLVASFADHNLVSKEGKLFWMPKNLGSETEGLPSLNTKTELARLLLSELTNILSAIAKKPIECDEANFCRAVESEITSGDFEAVEERHFTVQNHKMSYSSDGRVSVRTSQGYDLFFKDTAQASQFIALKLRSTLSLRNDAFLVASFGSKNLILFENSLFWVPHGIYFDQNDPQRHHMRIKCKVELQGLLYDEVSNNENTQVDQSSKCDEAALINNILLEIEQNLQNPDSLLSFGKYIFKVAPNGKCTVRSTDDREIVFKNIYDTINFLIIKFRDQIRVNATPILIASFQEHNLVSLNQELFWVPKQESFDYKNPQKTARWRVSHRELSNRITIETGVAKTDLEHIDVRLFDKTTYTTTIEEIA